MKIIKKQSILPRIDGILKDVEKLKKYSKVPLKEFSSPKNEYIALSQFYLRQALERVFHIGEHILSRLNGSRATEYKEIARKLGEFNIVNNDFANSKLVNMAGYRNRLTHFYANITPLEIYEIVKNNLDDFNIFLNAVKFLLKNPDKFNLKVGN